MIRKNKKLLLITSILILLPILAGVLLWNQLPDQMPSHWNGAGEIDGWCSKPIGVFGFPLFLLAIHWVCILGTYSDPKKNHHPEKVLQLIFWFIPILSIVMHTIVYAVSLGKEVNVNVIILALVGLVLTIVGNYLPKCQQNYTIGIKIPWTLNSEENWNRTHRFAGRLWVVCGLIIMFGGFFGGAFIFLPAVLLMVGAPVAYSYWFYRKESAENSLGE